MPIAKAEMLELELSNQWVLSRYQSWQKIMQ